jgi:hypothetical protein
MPSRVVDEEDWDHGDESWDEDRADDSEDEMGTVPCPHCRRQILEDTPRCPYCENYISEEDVPPMRKPWWIVLGTLLVLYIVYRWTVR